MIRFATPLILASLLAMRWNQPPPVPVEEAASPKALKAEIEALLTDAQKKQWKEMLGKPLDLDERPDPWTTLKVEQTTDYLF